MSYCVYVEGLDRYIVRILASGIWSWFTSDKKDILIQKSYCTTSIIYILDKHLVIIPCLTFGRKKIFFLKTKYSWRKCTDIKDIEWHLMIFTKILTGHSPLSKGLQPSATNVSYWTGHRCPSLSPYNLSWVFFLLLFASALLEVTHCLIVVWWVGGR